MRGSVLAPYAATFRARFQLMLQYRAAAVAGFGTQCWFGVVRILILTAFFRASGSHQPISLAQSVDYVWLGQAFLALLPWAGDPDIAAMMRSGNVSYDRLRPLDTYFYWYARAAAWMVARVVPRAALMFAFAGVLAPLCGWGAWGLHPPASAIAAGLFCLSMMLVVLLAAAVTNLLNAAIVATLNDRGVNLLASPIVVLLAGNVVPLPLFPAQLRLVMLLQPFAGLVDIPCRLYFGELEGASAALGLGAQLVWTVVLVLIGRAVLARALARLQAQGG
jgi:ABC-2 type transport system permease protein